MANLRPIVGYDDNHSPLKAEDVLSPSSVGMPAIKTTDGKQTSVGSCATGGIAIGISSAALANYSVAMGIVASSATENSIAIGYGASTVEDKKYNFTNGIAIGTNAKVYYDGTAIGSGSIAYRGIAIGGTIGNDGSLGVGALAMAGATATGQNTIAIGSQTNANNAIAIGVNAEAKNGGIAFGWRAVSSATGSALGSYCKNQAHLGFAIGFNSITSDTANQSVALGAYAVATRPNVVSLGYTWLCCITKS